MLKVKLVDEAATLNNFRYVEAKEYIPNFKFTINFQVLKVETNMRFMAQTGSKLNVVLQKSDGLTLVKTATKMFSPGDLSMWSISLSAAESNAIVGSNFQIFLDVPGDSTLGDLSDSTDLQTGAAYNVLAKVLFDGGDC